MQLVRNEQKFDPIDYGTYLAKIIDIKEKKSERHPEWAPQLQWTFEIVVDPYKKRRAWGYTPSTWTPGKKLDNWLKALHITSPNIQTQDLVGLYAKITVVTADNSDFQIVKEIGSVGKLDEAIIGEMSEAAKSPVSEKPSETQQAAARGGASVVSSSLERTEQGKSVNTQNAPVVKRNIPF